MLQLCYEIGRIEYSNANVFFWFTISNLFYAFGKQEELQSHVKGQIPKKWLQVRTRGLSMFGRVGLKNTFLFRETGVRFCYGAYDFMPDNWIIDYRFLLWKYADRINRIFTQCAI